MHEHLEKDLNGDIVMKPVIGWEIGPVAEIAVLLVIQYAETPADIQTGGKRIQFALTPQSALALAEALTKKGKSLLQSPEAGKPRQ